MSVGKCKFGHSAVGNVARGGRVRSKCAFQGEYHVQCFNAQDVLQWEREGHNDVVNQGLNDNLNVYFDALAATTQWFIGLLQDGGSYAAADTLASNSWAGEFTAYSEATRPEWAPGVSSGESITNATTRDFTITGTTGQIIEGMFLAANGVISETASKLWATALWTGGDQTVAGSDTLRVTYTVTAA